MRGKVVFVVVVAVFAVIVFFVAWLVRPPKAASVSDAAADVAAPVASADDSGIADAFTAAAADAGSLGRPLKVVGLGWEMLAPGVPVRESESGEEIERQLARGGGDNDGADVAIVPLPELVASYERLRALEPEVFLIVGWSKGREALVGKSAQLTASTKGDEVQVATSGDASGMALALFVLDVAGVAPSRVRFVKDPKGAPFMTAQPPLAADAPPDVPSKPLVTTGDASRLIPIVAVAPRGFVKTHADALAAFARAWLEGIEQLQKDVPAAARRVSSEHGAPEPSVLLQRLGQIEPVANLSAYGAVTIDSLFRRFWRLWREAGLLTTPPPETTPVTTAIVASSSGDAAAATPAANAKVLVTEKRNDPKTEDTALADEAAFLAGVFERSTVRVSSRAAGQAARVVAAAHDRFDVSAARLAVGNTPPEGAQTAIEVLAVP